MSTLFIAPLLMLVFGCSALTSKEATVGCQAADATTTAIALRHGAHEANPLMARVLSGAGLPGLFFTKAVLIWALVNFVDPKRSDTEKVALASLNTATCAVALHNLTVIR